MTVPIDLAGRIVLPKKIREELAIKPGDTLTISIHGSSVTLAPNKEATGFVRKGQALVFSTAEGGTLSHEAVNDLLKATREQRDEQNLPGLHARQRS